MLNVVYSPHVCDNCLEKHEYLYEICPVDQSLITKELKTLYLCEGCFHILVHKFLNSDHSGTHKNVVVNTGMENMPINCFDCGYNVCILPLSCDAQILPQYSKKRHERCPLCTI